jgi:hypothetical protein
MHDWKVDLVTWGLAFLFALKFLKFIALEVWDVLRPILQALRSRDPQ